LGESGWCLYLGAGCRVVGSEPHRRLRYRHRQRHVAQVVGLNLAEQVNIHYKRY
jgi:hypothetical protein